MTLNVPWQPDSTPRQVIAHLAAGGCAVLPTESTYEMVASAFHEPAARRVAQAAGENTPAIALGEVAEVEDWFPIFEGAGPRFVRKLGPGPYAIRSDAGVSFGLFQRLPDFARKAVSSVGGLQIRLPDHPIWNELRALGQPLISVPIAGAVDAEHAARLVSDQSVLIVDAGPAHLAAAPSVVTVHGRHAKLDRSGAITADLFAELTLCRILFVCTGNTCRSPMAEALCTKRLADRLGCAAADLKRHGYLVQSTGLAAATGSEASPEAVQVVAAIGADLSRHRSCMVTVEKLLWADHIFAMTAGHWHTLRSLDVPNLPAPEMLSPAYEDVADPIGGALSDYQTCAQQILDCLDQRLPQILES